MDGIKLCTTFLNYSLKDAIAQILFFIRLFIMKENCCRYLIKYVFVNPIIFFIFRFFVRNNKQLLTKAQSTPNLDGNFSAKPFPAHIFTGYAYEKMKSNLEFREIQKNIRKKALLERASLPPRMQKLQKSEKELKKMLKSAKNKVIM